MDDLRALFSDRTKYLKETRKHPARFWAPWIALYTGMRIEEICQLHICDIRDIDGLLITDGEPDDFQAALEAVTALQKLGIEIIGVGIHSCRLSVFVENQITITGLSELAPAMLTLLQQTLLKKGGRP